MSWVLLLRGVWGSMDVSKGCMDVSERCMDGCEGCGVLERIG